MQYYTFVHVCHKLLFSKFEKSFNKYDKDFDLFSPKYAPRQCRKRAVFDDVTHLAMVTGVGQRNFLLRYDSAANCCFPVRPIPSLLLFGNLKRASTAHFQNTKHLC